MKQYLNNIVVHDFKKLLKDRTLTLITTISIYNFTELIENVNCLKYSYALTTFIKKKCVSENFF